MEWTNFPKLELGKGTEGRILALPLAKDKGIAKTMIGTTPIDNDFYKGGSRLLEYKNKIIIAIGVESDKDSRKFGNAAWKAAEAFLGPVKFHLVPDFLDEEKTLEGALLGSYKFSKYLTEKKERPWIVFHGSEQNMNNALLKARATFITRDLVNEPTNKLYPESFAEMVRELFSGSKVEVKVYPYSWLKENGFGGIVSVGKGSENKPRLIVMKYCPTKTKPILIIGKGISFDSGGIHLKPTGYIEDMKMDMAGAATATGIIYGISKLGLQKDVIVITPMAENMPSGNAAKPGDVITMYNKKNVEIWNTDAEGRVVMADALAYGIEKFKPEISIDLATLTGACVIALGERIAGLMGTDQKTMNEIKKAGEETEEDFWQLPMAKHFAKKLDSDVADFRNSASKGYGGASIAAAFLKNFIKGNWVHIDIAGPATSKTGWLWNPKEGTGFGTRTIIEWLMNRK